jgi:flavodoxin
MNTAVVYFSRTGNTKRLAEAIAQAVQAKLYDITSASPISIAGFDCLILGTPVEGSSPTKEAMAFISSMSSVEGKKAIVFCTYKMFGNERTMKTVEKALSVKGYETLLHVSQKGTKPEKPADFSKVTAEVKAAMAKL